ncbi:MAG TPA: UDP-N-acetylglucosamine 2-epimerase [Alphaproteobacteria bacterium]
MTVRIAAVSSSRADSGIQSAVWRALVETAGTDLHVLLTGMHCRDDAAEAETPAAATTHRGGADLGGTEPAAAAAMAAIAAFAGEVYRRIRPDIVLVTGDRLDMLPAAAATLPFNLPVAHLHGGEISAGAVDDRIRHALTKLAHLHFVATAAAARRLAQMGEELWRIHLTGAPGLDRLRAAPRLAADALAAELDLPTVAGLRLVTVHSETNSSDPLAPLDAVLAALDADPAPTLFTAANSDPGGSAIAERVADFVAARGWAQYLATAGTTLYANLLRQAAVMVGNSSSGLIEAPLFGLPVVNVGGRQEGRERGANVIDCAAEAAAVRTALARAAAMPRRPGASPYGDGFSAPRIAALVAGLPERATLLAKRFAAPGAPAPEEIEAALRA